MHAKCKIAVHRWSLYSDDSLRAELCAGYADCSYYMHVVEKQLSISDVAARRHDIMTATDEHHVSILLINAK